MQINDSLINNITNCKKSFLKFVKIRDFWKI